MDLLSKDQNDWDTEGWFEAMNESGKRQAWERNHPGKRAYEPDVFEVEAENAKNGTGYYEIQEFDF